MNKKKQVKEAEVVPTPELPDAKYLITILVLSISLVRAIVKKDQTNTLNKEEGEKVIEFIGDSVKAMFPEIAPMIMGLFGVELIQLMPVLKNPEILVKSMVQSYSNSTFYVGPDSQPNTK